MKSEWKPDNLDISQGNYVACLKELLKAKQKLKAIAAAFDEYEKERKNYERKQYCQQTDDLEKQEQLTFAWKAKQRLLMLLKDEPIS